MIEQQSPGPPVIAVVLAAGMGKRMRSATPKVLHRVAGRPLLGWVFETARAVGCERILCVVGHQAERVGEVSARSGVHTALQAQQLGTGHAVEQAKPQLESRTGRTLVLCGDVPLIRTQTLRDLAEATAAVGVGAAVLTAVTEDASGYGRILRDGDGHVTGIVEEKDATEEQRRIREYNTGTYCFDNALLWPALNRLDQENAQGEFYLTDVIAILVDDGHQVEGVVCADEREVQGINTVSDLERARRDFLLLRGQDA